jgi:hypothetical protein
MNTQSYTCLLYNNLLLSGQAVKFGYTDLRFATVVAHGRKMLQSFGCIPYGIHPARQVLSFTERFIPDGMIFNNIEYSLKIKSLNF